MRFRHKLSIVLVGLAIVPLAATAVLVATLLQHDQVNTVDGRLSVAVAAAAQSYSARLQEAKVAAQAVASQPDIARAFPPLHKPADLTTGVPSTMRVALWQGNKLLQGVVPRPPYWSATTFVGRVGGPRRVVVYVPLDSALLGSIANGIDVSQPVGLAFVANGSTVAAYPAAVPGAFPHLPVGSAGDATAAGTSVRAEGAKLPQLTGGPAYVAATYPSATLQNAINSQRLRILVPLIVLGVILIGGAVFAADRISRALTELAGRAAGLSRGRPGGDELSQLGAAIDEISSELTSRMGELEAERGRFKETLQRYGETLAATHDLNALVGAVLDTAVQATRARGGRLLLYDAERGEAIEQARIGTARGSRTDLPMVVAAGVGIEGEALAGHEARVVQAPRAMLAVPILREHHLLGLVTAVDPEEGAFSDEDVEALSALALQAGVAIENARLHRDVE